MPQRQYDKATAQAIMQLAYPEYEGLPSAPYIENDDGMYVNESFRTASPPGTAFDWTPADDMDWPGSPNPNTAPFLPIPFTASELAACMLDGPGQSIQFALDRCIGYPLDDEALGSFHARHRWMRDTLEEAYALAAAAQLIVGEFDYDEKARAHTLALQYDDADGQANAREGVFEHGITTEEARARRARAVASVADLKAQAKQAQAAVADKWKAWRKAMVFQLLGTGTQQSHVAAQSPATPAPAPAEPAPVLPTKETPSERRVRWLAMFEKEERREKRGALQRLADREGVDRSNMSKDIAKAREERDTQRRAGTWAAQLVQNGKRAN